MRTPGHDDELAAGFLFTESIVQQPNDIVSIDPCGSAAPDSGHFNVIRVELSPTVEVDLGRLQRHFYTTSSCGVCGKASLDALRVVGVEAMNADGPLFEKHALISVPEKLRTQQDTFDKTGGLHAAAVFDVDGSLIATMEDIGRHNAVDKVIGALLLGDKLPAGDYGLSGFRTSQLRADAKGRRRRYPTIGSGERAVQSCGAGRAGIQYDTRRVFARQYL